ncbi:hypothetical protein KSP39_PZI019073 [Platanthera zijinensis]|uniref:UBN2 domain-containing protein n=1 Tax=Platanthera zijinensis TaxID=2320716 RepID=A0AAP0B1M7_9ASPA
MDHLMKEDKRSSLISQYDYFKKVPEESVANMFTRFSIIISELMGLDKKISLTEINNKILMCLPRSWDTRICAIRESRCQREITTKNHSRKLKSYELLLKTREPEDAMEKSSYSTKEKSIA